MELADFYEWLRKEMCLMLEIILKASDYSTATSLEGAFALLEKEGWSHVKSLDERHYVVTRRLLAIHWTAAGWPLDVFGRTVGRNLVARLPASSLSTNLRR